MDWVKLFSDIGIASVIGSSFTYLIKSFFDKSIKLYEKDLEHKHEAYKLEVNKTLEAYKSELSIFNYKISNLHSKRLEILGSLYELIASADLKMKTMASRIKMVTKDFDNEELIRITEAEKSYNEFLDFYNKKKIFFTNKTCKLIDSLLTEYFRAYSDYTYENRWKVDDREMVIQAGKRIEEQTPKVLEELQRDFRALLEVEKLT